MFTNSSFEYLHWSPILLFGFSFKSEPSLFMIRLLHAWNPAFKQECSILPSDPSEDTSYICSPAVYLLAQSRVPLCK